MVRAAPDLDRLTCRTGRSAGGRPHTRLDYTPYGVAMRSPAVDVTGDGLVDVFDLSAFMTVYNGGAGGAALKPGDPGYDPDADLSGSGDLGFFDFLAFQAMYGVYGPGGSAPAFNDGWLDNPNDENGPDNSVGYDGYWFDLAGATEATSTGLYMVRNRVYDPGLGRWMQRDPAGYVPCMSLVAYCDSKPTRFSDFKGLAPGDPSWENYRPGQDPPKCIPGSDEWYNYSPVCSDATWCRDKYQRQLTQLPAWTKCLLDHLAYTGPSSAICIGACAAKTGGTALALCVAACGAVEVGVATYLINVCLDAIKEKSYEARSSYCTCIAWKVRRCNKFNQETRVWGCPPGTDSGILPPPGTRISFEDIIN